jgi:glycerophosphoryl diester phosphodiesterase
MKFVAHRGASIEAQENTLEALRLGARLGAYACECDIRVTKDKSYVLFHDSDLARLTGDGDKLKDITEFEMREKLSAKGLSLTRLSDIKAEDLGESYLLCDLSSDLEYDDGLFKMLSELPVKVICGIHRPEEARMASKYFPPEQILAFLPDVKLAKEFYDNGAGIIRLWEAWTTHTPPEAIKAICPKAQVFIMSCNPETGYDGSTETIAHFEELNADGVLLNNIR